MRISIFGLICACVVLVATAPSSAQEGHPLKGSWIGTWESNQIHGEYVLVVLNWDGELITGMINPGTDNITIAAASLDPNEWAVHFEADADDGSGSTVHYVIDGKIEDLELPNRYITGTWRHQNNRGAFEIRRQ